MPDTFKPFHKRMQKPNQKQTSVSVKHHKKLLTKLLMRPVQFKAEPERPSWAYRKVLAYTIQRTLPVHW
jgi:hypothetical protein